MAAKATAISAIDDTGIPQETLRAQWHLQVAAQTRPAPRKLFISHSLVL